MEFSIDRLVELQKDLTINRGNTYSDSFVSCLIDDLLECHEKISTLEEKQACQQLDAESKWRLNYIKEIGLNRDYSSLR